MLTAIYKLYFKRKRPTKNNAMNNILFYNLLWCTFKKYLIKFKKQKLKYLKI